MRLPLVAVLFAGLVPSGATAQNPVAPGPRSQPCYEVPLAEVRDCLQDALELVRWRLDQFIEQRDRERTGFAAVDDAMRQRMGTLRGIQQQWETYVEGHCGYIAFGFDGQEATAELTCLIDAYDRRLSDLLPELCGVEEVTCEATEEFESRHQRR